MPTDSIKLIHIASHPVRFGILKELEKEKGKPLYINQLSERLNKIDRKIIAFHLMTLEDSGLVRTYVDLKVPAEGNPVAVRYTVLTDKAKETLAKLPA